MIESDPPHTEKERLQFYLWSAVVGTIAGGVASVFHALLDWSLDFHRQLSEEPGFGEWRSLITAAAIGAVMVLVARLLVRHVAPEAAGSGIQEVEGALEGERPLRWGRVLPVKFIAGVLAVGSGLVLGREGPTIHMGSCIGKMIAEAARLPRRWMNSLIAAGAGAGLAAAFNAPLAGVVFVLEEMRNQFSFSFAAFHAVVIACVTSTVMTDLVFGVGPFLDLPLYPLPPLSHMPGFAALGLFIGVFGILFNKGLLLALDGADRIGPRGMDVVAALAGAGVGVLLVVFPSAIGGGETMIPTVLHTVPSVLILVTLLMARTVLSIGSYTMGAPGGIFAPMLALGTLVGLAVGVGLDTFLPEIGAEPGMLAITAMGGLFAATVRAPVTGVILVVELTNNYTLVPAMIVTCLVASVTTEALGGRPIYESLLARTRRKGGDTANNGR